MPVFEDKSGTRHIYCPKKQKNSLPLLSKAGSLFKTLKKDVLEGLYKDSELNMRVNTFINSKVREGAPVGDPKSFVIGLRPFY